jgi:integrase
MGLRWADIDFDDGLVTKRRSRVLVDGKRTLEGGTKTERGARVLPLTDELTAALRTMREDQNSLGEEHLANGYLAVDESGADPPGSMECQWTSSALRRAVPSALNTAMPRRIRGKAARHSHD